MMGTTRRLLPACALLCLLSPSGFARTTSENPPDGAPAPVAVTVFAGVSGGDIGDGRHAAPTVGAGLLALGADDHLAVNLTAEFTSMRGSGRLLAGGVLPGDPSYDGPADVTLRAVLATLQLAYRGRAGAVAIEPYAGFSTLWIVDQEATATGSEAFDLGGFDWYRSLSAGLVLGMRLGWRRWSLDALWHAGLSDLHADGNEPQGVDGSGTPAFADPGAKHDVLRLAGGIVF